VDVTAPTAVTRLDFQGMSCSSGGLSNVNARIEIAEIEDVYRLEDDYRSSAFLAPDSAIRGVNYSASESTHLDRLGGLNLKIRVNKINVMNLPR
jgi:hypothetical protein